MLENRGEIGHYRPFHTFIHPMNHTRTSPKKLEKYFKLRFFLKNLNFLGHTMAQITFYQRPKSDKRKIGKLSILSLVFQPHEIMRFVSEDEGNAFLENEIGGRLAFTAT